MQKFNLKFTKLAQTDLDKTYYYISSTLISPRAAGRLMDSIEQSILRLLEFPLSCPCVEIEPFKTKGYRKLIVGNYIVFYKVDNKKRDVIIMRIVYGARNYKEVL